MDDRQITEVATQAKKILDAFYADPEYTAFETATLEYSSDWQCFTGFPVISEWNLDTDKGPLLTEGLRALALKAAVFDATGDEKTSELPIAVPVDEMTHAMIAQPQLLRRIADRIGMTVIHQTDQECTDYTGDSLTAQLYQAAWGQPPARYWLEKDEVEQRVIRLSELYASVGLNRSGREHSIAFDSTTV